MTAATRRWCGGGGDRRQRLAVWAVQIRAPFEGGGGGGGPGGRHPIQSNGQQARLVWAQ